MRCVIARFPFDLIKSEVEHSMAGREPEPVTSASVAIGPHSYPVEQVGEVITKQDRRESPPSPEVARALTRLGFVCHPVCHPLSRPQLGLWRPRNTPFGPAAPGPSPDRPDRRGRRRSPQPFVHGAPGTTVRTLVATKSTVA